MTALYLSRTIELPCRTTRTEEAEPLFQGDEPGILVVDDDASVRACLRACLEHAGLRVWLAGSGEEAVELCQEYTEAVAVALLDVQMPKCDGPETLARLRRINPSVRSLFMSSDTGAYTVEELLRRGALQVLPKPFSVAGLIGTLHRLLRTTQD